VVKPDAGLVDERSAGGNLQSTVNNQKSWAV
jgi:hypothetical protein